MNVPSTVIEDGIKPSCVLREVAPVDIVAIQGEANEGWVGGDGGVVFFRVKTIWTKGVPVQMRNSTPLSHVFIAIINFALLRCVLRIIVEGRINSLTLQSVSHVAVLGKCVS